MACRRSIIARTKLFYQHHQRFAPSFSHRHSSGSDCEELPAKRNSEIRSHFLVTRNSAANSLLSGNASRVMLPAGYGLIFHRNLSKVPSDIEFVQDFNGMIGDKAVEAAPVVNEVAIAAADSFAPVAAFQYLIDYVHCFTGFEWWASIAAATLAIRFIELPILVHQLKFLSKNHTTVIPQMLKITEVFKSQEHDFAKAAKLTDKLADKLIDKYGRIQLWGVLISDVSKCLFFFAILNMAEKVPSFVTGGTLWFTDLTTVGSISLPVLFALTLWIRLELDPKHYVKGNTKTPTSVSVFFAAVALLGVVIAGLPTATYCYFITSNLFSIAYAVVVIDPRVQKMLGISLKLPSTRKKTR